MLTPIQSAEELQKKREEVIRAMPARLFERVFYVAFDQSTASNARPLIRNIKGDDYDEMIDARAVQGISEWGVSRNGQNLWSDSFVFDPSIWENFSDIQQRDQDFILMLVSKLDLNEFFGTKPAENPMKPSVTEETWFTKVRKKIATWIMP